MLDKVYEHAEGLIPEAIKRAGFMAKSEWEIERGRMSSHFNKWEMSRINGSKHHILNGIAEMMNGVRDDTWTEADD
jgi:hypothetical protein